VDMPLTKSVREAGSAPKRCRARDGEWDLILSAELFEHCGYPAPRCAQGALKLIRRNQKFGQRRPRFLLRRARDVVTRKSEINHEAAGHALLHWTAECPFDVWSMFGQTKIWAS